MKAQFFGIGLAQNLEQPHPSKAQAATEYMVIAAIVLAMSSIIFFYSWYLSHSSLSTGRAAEAADTIAAAIDYVYSLGYGTQTAVDIELPENVISSKVGDREVVFTISSAGRSNDIVAITKANATGILPTSSGKHQILVNYSESGVVVG